VRNARLLDDRVTRAKHDLVSAGHKRDLAAQNGDVVQRAGGVRSLELGVLGFARLAGAGDTPPIVGRRYLDDPEAGAARGGSSAQCRVEVSVSPGAIGLRPETHSSVVVYRPAWITVGGSPAAMTVGLPPASKPVTTLFTQSSIFWAGRAPTRPSARQVSQARGPTTWSPFPHGLSCAVAGVAVKASGPGRGRSPPAGHRPPATGRTGALSR